MNKLWQSEPHKNLTFSLFKVFPKLTVKNSFVINCAVTLGVVKALEEIYKIDFKLKWPNDILSDENKIGGILIENIIKRDRFSGSIIGIGININQELFEGLPRASSLFLKTGYKAEDGIPRLNILEVQRLIRIMPKVVIAVVPGWAVGGGHSLHVTCDLTLASKEHAIFKQTDTDVASFDGGFGSAYLARQIGQKRAREIFFLGRNYSAQEAFEMGMVNAVVPHDKLEETAYQWAQEILQKSPTATKMVKFAFNLIDDGLVGQQVFAGEATRLAYMTDEAEEGKNAFLEKRKPNWEKFKRSPS